MLSLVIRNVLSSANVNIFSRTLYTASALGMDGYITARENVSRQFASSSDSFKNKMKEFVDGSSRNMIFTEDLKNMVHLCDNSKEDNELIVNMMKKFNTQNKEMRFGNYVFGPVVMRMFSFIKDENTALQCFKEPLLDGFFDQLISYQILMDMLYETKRYQDVLDVFEIVKAKQLISGRYPKHCVTLVLASAYKQNTQESFDYAMKLWQELQTAGHIPMRKAATFAAALALNFNAPHIAIEITGTIKQQNYVTVRNLKVAAMIDLNRPDETTAIFRAMVEINDPRNRKHNFSQEIIDKLHNWYEKFGKPMPSDLKRIVEFLSQNGHITKDSLDTLLCTEIDAMVRTNEFQNRDRRVLAASFTKPGDNMSQRRQQAYRPNRPGLNDLY